MMRQTSLDAYQSLDEWALSERQLQVFKALKLRPMTNLEISQISGLPINCVTPRVGELVGKGWIAPAGTKIQPSGRKAMVWAVV